MKADIKTWFRSNALSIFALVLIVGYWLFTPNPEAIAIEPLSQANHNYLNSIKEQAEQDFFHLAELQATLEVVQSSDVGVSFIAEFNVQVGNALQALTQLLQRASLVTISALAAIELIELIHDLVDVLSLPTAILASCVLSFYLALKIIYPSSRALQPLKSLAIGTTAIFIFCRLLFPYAIHLTAYISHELSYPSTSVTSKTLENMHGEIVIHTNEREKLKDNAKNSINHLKQITHTELHSKNENLLAYLVTTIAHHIFNLLVVPFGFLMMFIFGMKKLVREFLPDKYALLMDEELAQINKMVKRQLQ